MTAARTKVKPPISASYTLSITGGVAVNVRANIVPSAWPSSYFVLYRDDEEIATSLSVPSYRDTDVLAGVQYKYGFATVNVHEIEGPPSSGLSVIVPANPIWETGWSIALDQNTSQDISARAEDPLGLPLTFSRQGGTAPGGTTVSSAGVVSVGLSAAGTYTLVIRADNGHLATDTTVSIVVSAIVTAPNPPTWVGAGAIAVGSGQIDLAWAAPTSGPTPTGYELNRSLTGSGGWSGNLVSGTGLTFQDTGRNPNTQYFYRLRTVNSGLFSSYITANATTEPVTSSEADFIIPAGTGSWNGGVARVPLTGGPARAVRAGDIIELEAGNYTRLTLTDIAPADNTILNPNTDYVTVRGPATGKATITASAGTGSLLQLNGTINVIFDGESQTTAPDEDGKRRNIRVLWTGTGDPVQLVKCGEGSRSGYKQSRRYVFRYIEIGGNWPGSGSQGARIAFSGNGPAEARDFTPGYGTPAQEPDGAWQEHTLFEHLFIHNVAAEAIYQGHNPYDAGTAAGRAPPVRYCKIRYCYFRDCGGNVINPKSWYGGQGGPDQFPTTFDWDTNNSIHDNTIIRGGTNPVGNPPLGPAISCRSAKVDIYRNIIETTGGWAISFGVDEDTNDNFPVGESKTFATRIYANLIKGANSKGGIKVNTDVDIANQNLVAFYPLARIFSNTIVSVTGNCIKFDAAVDPGSFARNNIALGSTQAAIAWGGAPNENAKNLITGAVSTAIFVDVTGSIEAGTVDFHLSAAQPRATGSILGVDISSVDLDGDTRVLANADMGAYEFP